MVRIALIALALPLLVAGRETTDDFAGGLGQWVVEQMPGGTVQANAGQLVIQDKKGCTVWLKTRIHAPTTIDYEARVSSEARVSDLNCFFLATEPATPEHFFDAFPQRTGLFSDYDRLATYYVGIGGNNNSTTRFRRYDGTGSRPLLPEHDLKTRNVLLTADQWYHLRIDVSAEGRVVVARDGATLFDWQDPEPLRSGWFGFRTVDSLIQIRNFKVHDSPPGETAKPDSQ